MSITKYYKYCIDYHPSKANVVAYALSQKSPSFSTALLITQKHIIVDLVILGVEIVTRDSQSYLVSLSVQPSLIDKK